MARTDYVALQRHAATLLKRAKSSHSERDNAFATAYLGAYHVTSGNIKKGFGLLSSAHEWGKLHNNDTVTALALNGLGIYYILSENNPVVALKYLSQARKCAKKSDCHPLTYRIDSNIIQISILRKDTTMLDYATRVFEESENLNLPISRSILARHIARLFIMCDKDAEALKYLDIADKIGGQKDRDHLSGEMLRGEIYNRQNNYKAAKATYFKVLDASPVVSQQADALLGLAMVCLKEKNFTGCKDYALRVLDLTRQSNMEVYGEPCYQLLAKAYAELGNWKEAYEAETKFMEYHERQCDLDNEYVQKQITTAMQVEKKEQEIEMRRKEAAEMRQRAIILVIALMLVIGLSAGLIREIRKKNRLYKTIVAQFKEAIAANDRLRLQSWQMSPSPDNNHNENEITSSENLLTSTPPSEITGEIKEEDEQAIPLPKNMADELWQKIITALETDEVYRDINLTRESLAKLIGTNRTYLSKIIFAYTGMSYNQFINTYRINEAIRILSDKDNQNYPIKALCSDIGYSSMTTFYKLFKERTRMTPSTFRKNA